MVLFFQGVVALIVDEEYLVTRLIEGDGVAGKIGVTEGRWARV